MKKKIVLKGKIELKKADGLITVIASDETLDRHGDVLPIDQWDLTKFMLSPRMLVDHNHEVASIVGKWNNVRIENNKLLMDADFHGFTDLSKAVKQMVDEGYLDTVSVGFIFNGPDKDGGKPSFELIETSWVTVPANPSARVMKDAFEKGITAEAKAKVAEYFGKSEAELESSDPLLDDEDGEAEDIEPVIVAPEVGTPEKPIATEEEAKDFKKEGKEKVTLSLSFFEKLMADSEQLKTLAKEQAKVEEDKKRTDLITLALKGVAGHVSHALRDLNKVK